MSEILRTESEMVSRVKLNNEIKFWGQYICELRKTGPDLQKNILFYRQRRHIYIKSPKFMPHAERLLIYNKYVYHHVDSNEIPSIKRIIEK